VCILSDIKIPFILRPKRDTAEPSQAGSPGILDSSGSQEESQYEELASMLENETAVPCRYQMMGDAYVHGLMNGEAAKRLGSKLDDSLKILHIV